MWMRRRRTIDAPWNGGRGWPFARRGLFRCLLKRGDYEGGEQERKRIEDLCKPLTDDLLVELGILPFSRGNYDEALRYFDDAEAVSRSKRRAHDTSSTSP
jgi:tetratricopeptide (TPR) repeat protein